jgi:hypothetical protein
MKTSTLLVAGCVLALGLGACKKDETATPDSTAVDTTASTMNDTAAADTGKPKDTAYVVGTDTAKHIVDSANAAKDTAKAGTTSSSKPSSTKTSTTHKTTTTTTVSTPTPATSESHRDGTPSTTTSSGHRTTSGGTTTSSGTSTSSGTGTAPEGTSSRRHR